MNHGGMVNTLAIAVGANTVSNIQKSRFRNNVPTHEKTLIIANYPTVIAQRQVHEVSSAQNNNQVSISNVNLKKNKIYIA